MTKAKATVMVDGVPIEYVEPYISQDVNDNGILTLRGMDKSGYWKWTRVFPPDVWMSLTIERHSDE